MAALCHGCQQQGYLKWVCQILRKGKAKTPANKVRAVAQAQEEEEMGDESAPPNYGPENDKQPPDGFVFVWFSLLLKLMFYFLFSKLT